MRPAHRWLLAGWLSSLVPALPAFAQADDPAARVADVKDLSLEELLDTAVEVATKTAVSARETPAVVTVLTREEIVGSGARDLIDLLELVPGFFLGVDVEGTVGIGLRGNWGHEGKVLLLIDGQEQNELLYATLQLGHELPVDQVERIEIIRGPGSATYGGFAELGVINVVTRGASLGGMWVGGRLGAMPTALGGRSLGFQLGQRFREANDLAISVSGSIAASPRSDRVYRDVYGADLPLADRSELGATMLNLSAAYQGLTLRYLFDDYRLASQDGFDAILSEPEAMRFRSHYFEASYTRAFGPGLSITPRLQFKRQSPWEVEDADSELFYRKTAQRILGGVTASWDAREGLNLLAGVEGYFEHARLDDPREAGAQTLFNGTDTEVAYQNVAGFAQALWLNPIVNVTVGARAELHSAFGASFVPRVGLTKALGRFHFKALYAQAFRAPSIESISLGKDIRPERTAVLEAELGYQLTDHLFLAVNAYDITIKSPIVYGYDGETDAELYLNFARTGTRGGELDFRARYGWGWVNLGYSLYTANGKNEVASYEVPGHPELLLGAPAHKVTLNAGISVGPQWSINPSGTFLSSRFSYAESDPAGALVLSESGPTTLLHLFVTRHDLLGRGVDLSAGVRNLLDARRDYAQPYDGGHAPLPGPGREVIVRFSAQTDFVR